jgi:hypothetical protein
MAHAGGAHSDGGGGDGGGAACANPAAPPQCEAPLAGGRTEPSTPRPCGACHRCGAQVKDATRVLVCDTCGCRCGACDSLRARAHNVRVFRPRRDGACARGSDRPRR